MHRFLFVRITSSNTTPYFSRIALNRIRVYNQFYMHALIMFQLGFEEYTHSYRTSKRKNQKITTKKNAMSQEEEDLDALGFLDDFASESQLSQLNDNDSSNTFHLWIPF